MPFELTNVTYSYPQAAALKDVSLRIQDGEFLGIMGHTGCGKTTLLQIMAGLITPSSGQVMLDGKDIFSKKYDRRELRQKVGLVFQHPECQLFERTVEKDVAFGLKYSGLSHREISLGVDEALALMGFEPDKLRGQSPLALSGGEKRRVAIAGVLVQKPKVLMLDEPIAGLDPQGRESFLETIARLNQQGTTIIMVSHNADGLAQYAKRLLVLDRGHIAMDGTARDIFSATEGLQALGLKASIPSQIAHRLALSKEIITYNDLLQGIIGRMKGGD